MTRNKAMNIVLSMLVVLALSTSMHNAGVVQAGTLAKAKNKIKDPGFENGSSKWKQSSTFWPSIICDGDCDNDTGQTHARTGEWWAWFGGNEGGENASVLSQKVKFPDGGAGTLSLWLYIEHDSGNGGDQISVYIDDERLLKVKTDDDRYDDGYTLIELDAGDYCDGQRHRIKFRCTTGGSPSYANFWVDDVSLVKS